MFLPLFVSVCRSVCPQDYSKSCEAILVNFLEAMGRGPRNNQLHFGGDQDPGFFKGFFIHLLPQFLQTVSE